MTILSNCQLSRPSLTVHRNYNPDHKLVESSFSGKVITAEDPEQFLAWMKQRAAGNSELENRIEKAAVILFEKKQAYKRAKQDIAALKHKNSEKAEFFDKLLSGYKLSKCMRLLHCLCDSVIICEYPLRQRRSEIISSFNELSKAEKKGGSEQIKKSVSKVIKELDRIVAYADFASDLVPSKTNSLVWQKIQYFCKKIIPDTFRSAIPIAIGLVTFHQLSGSGSLFMQLAGAGLTAAISASAVAWSQLKSGSDYHSEFKQAGRGVIRTLAIGAGVQSVILLQQFAEKSGFYFDSSWSKLIFFAMVGGLLDAVIGYCVDVSQLVSDKLEKYYSKKMSPKDPSITPARSYMLEELERIKLIYKDLIKTDSRKDLKNFLTQEGIRPDKLAKSILFDLTAGVLFSLLSAHLQALRAESRSLIKATAAHSSSKLLAWSEKMLTRGVRTSLTNPKVRAAANTRIEDSLKDLIEAVVE